ncbi:unnamed protein product, partial [Musa banksii]
DQSCAPSFFAALVLICRSWRAVLLCAWYRGQTLAANSSPRVTKAGKRSRK